MPHALLYLLGSVFVLAALAPLVYRAAGRRTGVVLALLPAGWFAAALLARPGSPDALSIVSVPWLPALRLVPSFAWDGLSALFAMLILGIGSLVLVYADGYREGAVRQGRFLGYLLFFMGAMLGVVLAADLITLFIFWELTSLASYLLIGFERERRAARDAALQALLVTGLGGMALLAAGLLVGETMGTYEIHALVAQRDAVVAHPSYPIVLALVLLGAFTKSAQLPFHFWLPSAMEAPTPVSSYLHSATMVKAGVYLLARMTPVLGGTDAWLVTLTVTGTATLLVAGVLAVAAREAKQALAYSTVATLGLLVALIGTGTPEALHAAVALVMAHALYKASLFQVAGNLLHGTGHARLAGLGGLRKALPLSAAAGAVAAAAMIGVPPTFGFIAKELTLTATVHPALMLLVAAGSALLSTVALVVGVRPFHGRPLAAGGPAAADGQPHAAAAHAHDAHDSHGPATPHEGGWTLWAPPLTMATLGLLAGALPAFLADPVVIAAASTLGVEARPMHLWHGVNLALLVSTAVALLAIALAFTWPRWHPPLATVVDGLAGPSDAYTRGLTELFAGADRLSRWLQHGVLRHYVFVVILTGVLLAIVPLWFADLTPFAEAPDVHLHEVLVAALTMVAAVAATLTRSRLMAITALGCVGYGVAVIFATFGAPDLAMTQFAVETLTVVLLLLVLRHLPPVAARTTRGEHLRNLVVAVAVGAVMALLAVEATVAQWGPAVSSYFLEHSLPDAHGANVVNVILVDFRALDTLGEITVLATAALGVWALVRLRPRREDTSWIP
jgi:multicomponent Na+:H+ antiporter subunit A